SVVEGNQDVIAATMATLHEFPDRKLLGEDVIWCQGESDHLLSSHRLLCTATHTNNGVYGQATGTKLRYRIIADCAARNNVIDDEWLVRDQSAIVRQMGWDLETYARALIDSEGGADKCVQPYTPANDVTGPYKGNGNGHEVGQKYADILTTLMTADFSTIPKTYDRACQLELPGGQAQHGREEADKFWLGLRAAFPSAQFQVHHLMGRTDDDMPSTAAVRWSLTGKHEGWGMFGKPTNADIFVMGISHAEFGPRGLKREFVAVDETAIWKQIILKTG
ncbi:MAG: nuclear transport factor 2 family protein, partial [Alphaproteobacteria bacterium]